ncbi:oleate hydratase [Actinomyces minihominis]|uniref:oleate hydratase n=1 Tax=Actinomyces minihominis TaxID=2002838 RepID=UPI000C078C15|nr:oleate hydratase [Actinomyces minihominis]
MYYSSGNYEAFARPKKPVGAENKRAWIVGSGLAGLAAAGFLVRDGQLNPEQITILEASKVDGGALDGAGNELTGWLLRGGREMEAHFECLWDLYRSVPSLEVDGSVLDEFYWLNKEDPNFTKRRVTINQGEDAGLEGKFGLSMEAMKDIMDLVLALPEKLYDKRIEEVMGKDFLESNFWLYWRTMFAFEQWHSALEMKLYLARFIHDIAGLPDMSALKFTKYNQYESLVLPAKKWLRDSGVTFQNDSKVTDVQFEINDVEGVKRAKTLTYLRGGEEVVLDLTDDDLVFVTNGSLVENSSWGDMGTPAKFDPEIHEGGSWWLWRKIAAQDPSFGNPDNFCTKTNESQWESATVTVKDDRIRKYIEKICERPTNTGKTVTGGIVTCKDSGWLMSWTVNRQPQFCNQPDDQTVVWVYGLFTDREGDFIKKPMRDCTGREIAQEWLFQMGVPIEEIDELSREESLICNPCMMPFITAFFLPRNGTDRPQVVPEGVTNFAFIGQFAECSRDTIFTTEYSVRTAMVAVYTLLEVDRGVPEVFNSVYDVRQLLKAAAYMRDRKPYPVPKFIREFIEGNELGKMMAQYGVIKAVGDIPEPSEAVRAKGV